MINDTLALPQWLRKYKYSTKTSAAMILYNIVEKYTEKDVWLTINKTFEIWIQFICMY